MDTSFKELSRSHLVEIGAIFEFEGTNRFLSNFGDGAVEMYGIIFPTVEHAFAAAKLDPNGGVHPRTTVLKEMRRIANIPTPGKAKGAGRRRSWNGKPFLRPDWENVKLDLILELVRRKFQDPSLARKLLATGDVLLVEGNTWDDTTWGMIEEGGVFRGTNWLGEILMQIRADLRSAQAS